MNQDEISKAGKILSALGGAARAKMLTKAERSVIASNAVKARWAKAGKAQPVKSEGMPYSMFNGTLEVAGLELPCDVLNDGTRVLSRVGVERALERGNKGKKHHDGELPDFIGLKALEPFIDADLSMTASNPILYKPFNGVRALGIPAETIPRICEAWLRARDAGVLKPNQFKTARQAEVLMRAFAHIGIIALVDEATGYQKIRAKQALQLKLQAFIAEELQEWAVMFPQEFWFELARLEKVAYSAKSRPLRWGKYIMMFVYDAIDPEVGKELRSKNPNPHFRKNHHQWLKQFGQDKLRMQIERVITIMKLCDDMEEFKRQFAKVFAKSPLQLDFNFA